MTHSLLQPHEELDRVAGLAAAAHPLMGAYVDHMRTANLARTTMVDRIEVLLRLHADLPHGLVGRDATASTAELEAWLGRAEWKPATRYTYHGHIVAFFTWATDTEHIDINPTRHLARPRKPESVPDPISDRELRRALEASNSRWRRVCILAAYAGLRAGEIGRLRREDVTEQRIRVINGKGGRDAYVPTSPEIWAAVEPVDTEYVSAHRYDRAAHPHTLSNSARLHFQRIGLDGVHLHRLRHWYGTSLLEAGVDLATVSKLMRHRSVQTTMGYLAIVDSRREAAVRLLPTFGHGGTVLATIQHGPVAA